MDIPALSIAMSTERVQRDWSLALMSKTLDTMELHCDNGKDYGGKCFICHSNNLKDALLTKEKIKERFPHIKGEIKVCDIGPIIASHAGPGTIAVFFHGDERVE